MILQRLVEYYDRLASDPATTTALAKPGYSLQKVSFCVVLEPDGRLQQFQSLLDAGQKKAIPRQLLVPGQSKPSGPGINPCFLWDNAAYLIGFKPDDPNPQRTRESFEAFRKRHLQAQEQIDSPAFTAVCAFLRGWSPEQATGHAAELKDIISNFGVFRIAGERQFVHDDTPVLAYWAAQQTGAVDPPRGLCLVTGRDEPIARLHEPKIKGVVGAQPAGALLVSFNDPAYESLGKEQSYNAPVSVSAAFKYTNALNYLLARKDRRMSLGDATVVFWAGRYTPVENFMSELLADVGVNTKSPPEDKARREQAQLFVSQVRDGHATADAIRDDENTPFYILGLFPGALSRIAVRFWLDTTVGCLKVRLMQHMSDTRLDSGNTDVPMTIRQMVNTTARLNKGKPAYDSISPHLAGDVARAILEGLPYPRQLLSAVIGRIRADGVIDHSRAAVAKACVIRNSNVEVPVALNPQHPSPSYHCGRLLALLDYAQGMAIGNVNAGIVKKFYGSASTQPAAVFGRLVAAATKAHIPKIKELGLRQFIDRRMQQITAKIGDSFPAVFSLEEQGMFAIGFYQEKAELPQTPPAYGHQTERGEQVISKSEVVLANMLHSLRVNYQYEAPLAIPGFRPIYPDFTVLGDSPSATIYIEHLGLLDSDSYKQKWESKLKKYELAGILPWENGGGINGKLVTTQESKEKGLDAAAIRHYFERIFSPAE